MAKSPVLPYTNVTSRPLTQRSLNTRWVPCMFIGAILILWYNYSCLAITSTSRQTKQEKFLQCSIDAYLSTGLPFLATAEQPPLSEYILRRNNLAQALIDSEIDAFIAEPGYTFTYYANVTQPQWEPWEPEERPFLMIIRPQKLPSGEIIANTSFLVPHFEQERARLLSMPFAEPIHTIPYEDHWNPWTTLYTSPIWTPILSPKIAVDDEIRDFIPRALASTAFSVSGPTHAITSIRQLKTPLETGILRAVNTGTVEAIRATRTCLYPDVTENTVQSVLDATLQAAGLTPFFAIVQFGESAALPHGGYDGRRQLKPEMMVLIDVGAHLYGYSSDVTRTFYAPFAREAGEEESRVWRVVRDAQIAGVKAVVWNGTAAGVDGAAREVVVRAGYGEGFTHRVGHGIGIKAHEGPYLDGGNFGAVLRPGMVFAVEPGVYLVGRFGVRLEDVVLVREDGEAESLSGRFAGSVWDP